MIGSAIMKTAIHSVARIAAILASPRPYWGRESQQRAGRSLVQTFGRFVPAPEEAGIWQPGRGQIVVSQLGTTDLSDKEPTLEAVSRESSFLGERANVAIWDDVETTGVVTPDARAALRAWWETEVETRIEPGGLLCLVGSRLHPDDLLGDRLNVVTLDDGPKYTALQFAAHDPDCVAQEHAQQRSHGGCLLDAARLPWRELQELQVHDERRFRLSYQQLDTGWAVPFPEESVLACLDPDRGFDDTPDIPDLVHYASVDPGGGGLTARRESAWVILWMAFDPVSRRRFLIRGLRSASLSAGQFLSFDGQGQLVGLAEEWQRESEARGQRISTWVVEQNSTQAMLMSFPHARAWKDRHALHVIAHVTGRNKHDQQLGVESMLPSLLASGLISVPYKRGDATAIRFAEDLRREAAQWPLGSTDCLMALWAGELHLDEILERARRRDGRTPPTMPMKLPRYLERQIVGMGNGRRGTWSPPPPAGFR